MTAAELIEAAINVVWRDGVARGGQNHTEKLAVARMVEALTWLGSEGRAKIEGLPIWTKTVAGGILVLFASMLCAPVQAQQPCCLIEGFTSRVVNRGAHQFHPVDNVGDGENFGVPTGYQQRHGERCRTVGPHRNRLNRRHHDRGRCPVV